MKAQMASKRFSLIFLNHSAGWGVNSQRLVQVATLWETGWAPGQLNESPPGFDHRTAQHVASLYADYAIPTRTNTMRIEQFSKLGDL
jgi:hypothetical protein